MSENQKECVLTRNIQRKRLGDDQGGVKKLKVYNLKKLEKKKDDVKPR